MKGVSLGEFLVFMAFSLRQTMATSLKENVKSFRHEQKYIEFETTTGLNGERNPKKRAKGEP